MINHLLCDESFLHCPSVSSKWGCVLYNEKGRSVVLSFRKNEMIMLYCHITYIYKQEYIRDECAVNRVYLLLTTFCRNDVVKRHTWAW